MANYLIQLSGMYLSGWSDGKPITADSDNEARENGRRYASEQKRLGQHVRGFRVLKVIHQGNS